MSASTPPAQCLCSGRGGCLCFQTGPRLCPCLLPATLTHWSDRVLVWRHTGISGCSSCCKPTRWLREGKHFAKIKPSWSPSSCTGWLFCSNHARRATPKSGVCRWLCRNQTLLSIGGQELGSTVSAMQRVFWLRIARRVSDESARLHFMRQVAGQLHLAGRHGDELRAVGRHGRAPLL